MLTSILINAEEVSSRRKTSQPFSSLYSFVFVKIDEGSIDNAKNEKNKMQIDMINFLTDISYHNIFRSPLTNNI